MNTDKKFVFLLLTSQICEDFVIFKVNAIFLYSICDIKIFRFVITEKIYWINSQFTVDFEWNLKIRCLNKKLLEEIQFKPRLKICTVKISIQGKILNIMTQNRPKLFQVLRSKANFGQIFHGKLNIEFLIKHWLEPLRALLRIRSIIHLLIKNHQVPGLNGILVHREMYSTLLKGNMTTMYFLLALQFWTEWTPTFLYGIF